MSELPWVEKAREYIGLSEVSGNQHNPKILHWLKYLKSWWADDEIPWCGTFVGAMLKESNRFVIKHWYRATAWAQGGTRLSGPAYGCIVVFSRKGGGHVGFVVGQDSNGNLMVLGGNQGNRVSIAPFNRSRVIAYVWPHKVDGSPAVPLPGRFALPLLESNGRVSTNEA